MFEKEETSFELSEFKLSPEAEGYQTKEMNYSFLNLNATPFIHGAKLNFNNSKLAYFRDNCAYMKHRLSFSCYH